MVAGQPALPVVRDWPPRRRRPRWIPGGDRDQALVRPERDGTARRRGGSGQVQVGRRPPAATPGPRPGSGHGRRPRQLPARTRRARAPRDPRRTGGSPRTVGSADRTSASSPSWQRGAWSRRRGQQSPVAGEDRIRVGGLRGDIPAGRVRADPEPRPAGREPGARFGGPRHRRPALVAVPPREVRPGERAGGSTLSSGGTATSIMPSSSP